MSLEASLAGAGVSIVHAAVPGRLRLRVRGLKGVSSLKRALEGALRGAHSISAANASVATGTLLLLFDPRSAAAAIVGAVEDVLLRYSAGKLELSAQPRAAPWHALRVDETLKRLRSSMQGLSAKAFTRRRRRYGENVLPAIPARDRMEMLLEQFQSLPVALLIGAAALSVVTGGVADAIVVVAVVALNAGIGYVTEAQTERAVRALSQHAREGVPVIRDGKRQVVPVESAVPGDMLDLLPGVIVAADARIVAADGLAINEATLTGESSPASKSAQPLDHRNVALADRANIVYRGTVVTGGSGRAVVVATGAATEIGQLQNFLSGASAPDTPLQKHLAQIGRRLTFLAGGACAAVFAVGLLRGFGLFATLKNAIALAVAAIPEGLPTLATTTLALGVREMRRRRVLIRKLDAVETLASVDVVCLDKTGTLTFNRMSAAEVSCDGAAYRCDNVFSPPPPGSALRRLAEIVALCNEAPEDEKDPHNGSAPSATETALLDFAKKAGVDVRRLRRDYPLERVSYRSERQLFMTTLHSARRGAKLAAVKGSPEEVLGLCSHAALRNETVALTAEMRRDVRQENARLAGEGQRVLGVAWRAFRGENPPPGGLVFLGLVGLADPLRPGAAELLGALRRAGVHPVMITGDQRLTAAAVARALDLCDGGDPQIIDADAIPMLEHMSKDAKIPQVFARVTPGQKLEIVKALQRAGHVVAMTGDGVNDSPALKAADIGVAMGSSGSEAARDVADIILQDDRLQTLIPAIRQGRATHANIRRAIRYLLATNMSEILLMLLAPAFNLGQPLTPAQLLWINLVTDVAPALALGLEPPHDDVMNGSPTPTGDDVMDARSARTLAREAGFITAGSLGAYLYGVLKYGLSPRARTICFTSIVAAQVLHALGARSEKHGLMSPDLPRNPTLSGVVAGSLALQALTMAFPPLRSLLGVAPIGRLDLAAAIAGAAAPLVANEFVKLTGSAGTEANAARTI
ncbi:cation-translocating P-type ATPase [Methylocystis parvus]|uniref:Cation-transporting P-type ATPase n=1 Tax=Methylocystis parvus TaxID=134 RepID=A0A6B8M995_9HYPH|nr:HAD-IC family P-type ATPase [Methylocystis parvus]QGM97873.1 cation-transporting P-type ATPase [Methylocystis parvus]WBK01818.1 cation-transporting P-type ATPase [Methylocystis parvus OBBP]